MGFPKGENQIRVHHPFGHMADESAFLPEFRQCVKRGYAGSETDFSDQVGESLLLDTSARDENAGLSVPKTEGD